MTARPIKLTGKFAGIEQPDDGAKVLWLHGYTLDSTSWRRMWELLPGWHHIGIDLPGHGASAAAGEFTDLRDVGRQLGEMCQAEDIHHVVALSFGTVMATQLAIEFPDYLTSLVLSAPSLAGAPQDPEVGTAYQKLFVIYSRSGSPEEMKQVWMDCRAWNGINDHPDLKHTLGALVSAHSWDEFNGFTLMRLMQPVQTTEQLKTITTPTLILIGDREMEVFKDCAKTLHENLHHSRVFTLPETDHLCLLQTPELSAEQIAAHLNEYAN